MPDTSNKDIHSPLSELYISLHQLPRAINNILADGSDVVLVSDSNIPRDDLVDHDSTLVGASSAP